MLKKIETEYFRDLLENDPGFNMLHSRDSAFIISFLYKVFRSDNSTSAIESEEIESRLASYLLEHPEDEQELNADENEEIDYSADYQIKAQRYINNWCDKKKYLYRTYSKQRNKIIELNPSIERLFNWIENCEKKEFVGTESRFQSILFQLRNLNQNINEDPQERIEALKKQKKDIDKEIEQIKNTGRVKTYNQNQIKEYLNEIDRSSRELLSEFKQVEENFRSNIKDIYKKQSEVDSTRGEILGYTLDVDNKLRKSPQGQSFFTFWNFLSQDSENEINSIASSIVSKTEIQDEFILQLRHYLFDAGHKIIEQNRTLTDRISQLLKQQTAGERKRVSKLIADIKKEMGTYEEKVSSGMDKAGRDFIEIETKPDLYFPQARTVPLPEKSIRFTDISSFNADVIDLSSIQGLVDSSFVDEKVLKNHVSLYRSKTNKVQFTLKDLVSEYPVEKGIGELVAWFALAQKEEKIIINPLETDIIEIHRNGILIKVKVPRMIFA